MHNHYWSSLPSGENLVVANECSLLRQHNHKVNEHYRFSDEIRKNRLIGNVTGALSTPWNPYSAKAVRMRVYDRQTDVVHVHNTFPLLSPAIFKAIGNKSARVLTLHNYRLFCPAAIPMRDGNVCTQCIDKHSVLPALRYGCYRNSRLATFPLAASVALHRALGTWSKHVDAFIVLTEFQRDLMIKAGLPSELIHVKPNFYPGEPKVLAWNQRKPYVVFAGRLTAEKGVETLVRAWLMWGSSAPELRILGDGELKPILMKLASKQPDVPITFTGQLTAEETHNEVANSQLLVLPSEWFEGFPMVIREAFAFGTPVAASNIGPLPSIVNDGENGVIFSPGDSKSLLNIVQKAWNTKGELELLGSRARKSFDTLYSEEVNYDLLIDIYEKAIEVSQHRKST